MVDVPDDAWYLFYDANDGKFFYDANDEMFLRDGSVEVPLPAIPGEIDAVGGNIGGPTGERVVLIETLDVSEEVVSASWLALANHPIMSSMIGGATPGAAPFSIRLADRDFTSRHDDLEIASGYWDGRVLDPGSIAFTVPLVPVDNGAIETRFGQIIINNGDAIYDTILDFNQLVSQPIRIRLGRMKGYLGNFDTVCVARIVGIGTTTTELTLDIRDPATYAQNLFPTSMYSGTGGANGDADLAGTVKPVILGKVWNIAPLLINATSLIYQAHDGPIDSVTGVFDGGVALSVDSPGNYTTYALLAAATVGAGEYATCLAEGLIRVGSTPAFTLTAHINGHDDAGTSIRSIATWLASQLENELGLEIDDAAFASLPTSLAGWMWTEPFTLRDALSRFIGDAGWHWGSDINGVVTTRQLLSPDSGDVDRVYDEVDVLDLQRAPLPEGYEGIHHRRLVQYRRNWTNQSGAQIAATATEKARRSREWSTATASRVTGARNAIDPPVLQTSLYDKDDALGLAEHLLDLHGTFRRMFTMTTRIFNSLPVLGSTVMVRHRRFGLVNGSYFRVLDIELQLRDRQAVLLLWG